MKTPQPGSTPWAHQASQRTYDAHYAKVFLNQALPALRKQATFIGPRHDLTDTLALIVQAALLIAPHVDKPEVYLPCDKDRPRIISVMAQLSELGQSHSAEYPKPGNPA